MSKVTILSQEKYNEYLQLLHQVDVTKDPGWNRLLNSPSGPHICSEIKTLIEKSRQSESFIESIIWIRSMEQLVAEFPDIVSRLETTFKPIYEAAKAFDKWA